MVSQIFLIIIINLLTILSLTEARAHHFENSDRNYPTVVSANNEAFEQSSRDLDLSFSAGDDVERDEENFVRPSRNKIFYAVPEKSIVGRNKEFEPPTTLYKIVGSPIGRTSSEPRLNVILVPEENGKIFKVDNEHKGEIILELRVIANHDD